MATRQESLMNSKKTGDVAVDGLFFGLMAGIISGGILILGGLLADSNPLTILGWFDPRLSNQPLFGGLLHIAVSAVYGLIFAVIFRGISRLWNQAITLGWFFGLIYGLFLLFLAEGIFLTGLNSGLQEIPVWLFVLFHGIYGIILGILIARSYRLSPTSN